MGGLEQRPEQARLLRSIVSVLVRELDEPTAYDVMIDSLKQFGFALPRSVLELRLFVRSALRQELSGLVDHGRLDNVLREIDTTINRPVSRPPTVPGFRRPTVREKR